MVRVKSVRRGNFYASERTMGYGLRNGSQIFDNGRERYFNSTARRNNTQYEKARVATRNRATYLKGVAFNNAYSNAYSQRATENADRQYQRYRQMINRAARNMHAAADRNLKKAAMGNTAG